MNYYYYLRCYFDIGQTYRHYMERVVCAQSLEGAKQALKEKFPEAQGIEDLTIYSR